MKFNNSHKALAITLLIAGSLVLSVINLNIIKYQKTVIETLIDISMVEPIEEIIPDIETQKKETNKGFNDAEKPKHFSQAYQPIAPPKDYKRKPIERKEDTPKKPETEPEQKGTSHIQRDELTAFESVNAILKKQTTKSSSESGTKTTNTNSTVRYSLVNRSDVYLPIPIYLCEEKGTIIVNITVTKNGRVKETSINSSSNSNNKCLENSALQYAKKAQFNRGERTEQIGTITFTFEGK
ncbi:TonB family protein [Bizionia gelidisalsuginis]|uniref:TonB family protein n=1 Tax=Bizionia gelidisalsuginis TaxID=291188 RepID=A0ABY3M8F3_9FLAO|nr:TonB family protein [Bizionia gelidisalsuginis]TYC10190.1 TonB family protein [Bizionia gelidisalsuginis]